jgi:V8-like Glu-specific endopeptidase
MPSLKRLVSPVCRLLAIVCILTAVFLAALPWAGAAVEEETHLPLISYAPLDTQAASRPSSRTISAEEQQATLAFWTRERRASARSLDLRLAKEADLNYAALAIEADANSTPVSFPGALPDPVLTAQAQQRYASEWIVTTAETESTSTQSYEYPPPFTRYSVNTASESWTQYPFSAIGRFFFTIPETEGAFSCSGAVLGGRAIWTAGHCVYSQGKGWHTDMVFYPAYRNQATPFGAFVASYQSTLDGWREDGWLAYDIGVVAVADVDGKTITQWAGKLGSSFNQGVIQHFHAFGYPVNFNGGNYLFACAASTATQNEATSDGKASPIGIGCDMAGGSSGGPWLVNYQPYQAGALNTINGVVSYYAPGRPQQIYTPYFGSAAQQLYELALEQ